MDDGQVLDRVLALALDNGEVRVGVLGGAVVRSAAPMWRPAVSDGDRAVPSDDGSGDHLR